MNTHAAHICINSFNYNYNKSSQNNSLLFWTTCFGPKAEAENKNKKVYIYIYVCVCVCVCIHTHSLYGTEILLFLC